MATTIVDEQMTRCDNSRDQLKENCTNDATSDYQEQLQQQLAALTDTNNLLTNKIKQFENEKLKTSKLIAMLEFNNEHNINKVHNMEISNDDLKLKINNLHKEIEKLQQQLRDGSTGVEEQLNKEKVELEDKLALTMEQAEEKLAQTTELAEEKLAQTTELAEEKLAQTTELAEEKCIEELTLLREQVVGLTEIRSSQEKQVKQIEDNNSAMHMKIAGIQEQRDVAKSEAATLIKEKIILQNDLENLSKIKTDLQSQLDTNKLEKCQVDERLETELNTISSLQEQITTLYNNITNLQKQIEDLNITNGQLTQDIETANCYKDKLNNLQEINEQLQARLTTITTTSTSDDDNTSQTINSKLQQNVAHSTTSTTTTSEVNSNNTDILRQIERLKTEKESINNKLVAGECESKKVKVELKVTKEHYEKIKSELRVREEEVYVVRDRLREVQDKLHMESVITAEGNNNRVKDLEKQLEDEQKCHIQQLKDLADDYNKQITAKDVKCSVTLASAYEQQDNETNALVRQQKDELSLAQGESKEKSSALDAVIQNHQTILKYEDQLASLKSQHQSQVKDVEGTWKTWADKLVKQKETQLQEEMDRLQQEWNKERKELEQLTQVAAAAFRSGTDSVELLKKQVASQRRELEEIKNNHKREMGALQALLEIKRRRGRGTQATDGSMKLGGSIEEAAEFEYLRNVLYQYMMGKETHTLAKVLCAVVKFDSKQELEILEQEQRRQSMVHNLSQGLGIY